MTDNISFKYIKHLSFTEGELQTKNPNLFKGEMACVVDTDGKIRRFKIGPGLFNDLDYVVDVYPYADLVTNEIGDILAGSTQENKQIADIIRDMISPYLKPSVNSVQTSVSGNNLINSLVEIGTTISGIVNVLFVVDNPANLEFGSPMEVLAPDFTVNNPYPHAVIALTPITPLSPPQPITYTIGVRAKDTNGNFSAYSNATIEFAPKIIWGSTTDADIVLVPPATELPIGSIGLQGGGEIVSSDYGKTYEIINGNYGFVLIPSMLNPVNISWTEVTDPNAPAGIGMVNLGSVNINNGTGVYNYTKWRTPFSNINGVKLKAQ